MPTILELLGQNAAPEAQAPVADDSPGQFGTGLRSGFYGAGAQLESAAGGAADAMGATGFGADRHAAARELQAQAEAAAPRVRSYKDVHGIRDAYDYATGLAGQSLPVAGAAIAGGLLTHKAPIVGSMLGMTPFETGDMVQRQQNDPVSMREGAGQRFRQALAGGVGSAAVNSVLPSLVGGKLVGGVASAAEKPLSTVLGHAAGELAVGGAGAGAGEAIKQGAHMASNPDLAFDPEAVKENVVGGLAGGLPLVGAGVAGDLGHKAAGAPGKAFAGAKNLAGQAVDGAKNLAGQAVDGAKDAAGEAINSDPGQAIKGVFDDAKGAAKEFYTRVKNGESVADLNPLKGKTPEEALAMMPGLDEQKIQKLKDTGVELMNRAGLTPERRQALGEMVDNIGDKASQAGIATAKLGADAGSSLAKGAASLFDTLSKTKPGAEGEAIKQSADYSGFEAKMRPAIEEHVIPALPEYALEGMSQQDQTKAINDVGKSLRVLFERTAAPDATPLSDHELRGFTDLFGDKTVSVLEGVHKAVASQDDPVGAEKFFGTLNRVMDLQQRDTDLVGTMQKHLADGVHASPDDLREVAQHLRAYAAGKAERNANPMAAERSRLQDRKLQTEMQNHFGDKADVVWSAVEKDVAQEAKANVLGKERTAVNDDGTTDLKDPETRLAERAAGQVEGDTIYYSPEKGGLALRPDHPKSLADPHGGQAKQALARATKENPDRNPKFLTASELGEGHPLVQEHMKHERNKYEEVHPDAGDAEITAHIKKGLKDYGVVAAEGTRQESAITKNDIKGLTMQGDGEKAKTSHLQHPARLQAEGGGVVYDAIALTKKMHDQEKEYTPSDNKGQAYRQARMFLDGVTALQDHLGKLIKFDDTTQIDKKGTTWGDVKNLDLSPGEGEGSQPAHQLRNDMAIAFKKAQKAGADSNELKSIAKVGAKARDDIEAARANDLSKGDDLSARDSTTPPQRDPNQGPQQAKPLGRGKDRTTEPSRRVHGETGEDVSATRKADPLNDSVTELAARQSGRVDEVNTNITGNAKVTDEGTGAPRMSASDVAGLRSKFEKMAGMDAASAKAVAAKGLALLDNLDVLNKSAQRAMRAMLTRGTNVSDVSSAVHALTEKYGKQFKNADAATKPGLADQKSTKGSAYQENPIKFKDGRKVGEAAKPNEALNRSALDAAKKDISGTDDHAAFTHDGEKYTVFQRRPGKYEITDSDNKSVAKFDGADVKPEGLTPKLRNAVDSMIGKEDYSRLDTEAKTDAFLIAAKKRWQELSAADATAGISDAEHTVLGRLERMFGDGYAQTNLASFYEDFGSGAKTHDSVRAMVDKAVPEVAANGPKGESEAYASTLKSAQKVDPNATGPADRTAITDHIDKVLSGVSVEPFAKIMHAGEFSRVNGKDIIRVSVHSMDPLGVAYHESLHAFFAKLKDQGNDSVAAVLKKAASSAPIMNQLKRLLAHSPEALAQLHDHEEAAAYMYQFWASGHLEVGTQTKTVFQKIADAFKKVMGIWTNDQRALEVMNYFHSGEFKANQGAPSAVARALVESGRSKALETAKSFTQPLRELANSVGVAGGQRLRDTGIPALHQLADAMKLSSIDKGKDQGYLPAARAEATRVMNKMSADLAGFSKDHLAEAMAAMQSGTKPASKEARMIQMAIQTGPNALLPSMFKYMGEKGVDLSKVQPKPDYFPRVFNPDYISRHTKELQTVLESHGVKDTQAVINKLMTADGSQFTVETDRPGMQFLKQRTLAHIPDAALEPFMQKDLYSIMKSYVTQATRRGEWAARLGDDGSKLHEMLAQAKAQGATPRQIETAQRYVKAVDGTLGDNSTWMTPGIRRAMGNMIVYQNIRLLPLAIFSSVVDPLGIVVAGGTVGDAFGAFKRGVMEIPKGFKKGAKDDAATQLAKTMGTIDDAVLVHTLGASYSQGMVGDTGRTFNDKFFKWNLMEQFNSSMRVAATVAGKDFLERHADGTASKHSERWMQELGFEKGEYKGDLNDPKTKMAINRFVDRAVLRPDAADKAIWMSDPQFALISHLKQFVFSFHETIIKRVMHEAKEGNYAPAMALASYVPTMIAADALKGIIQGGGDTPEWKKNWTAGDYVWNGVERGGLLGVGQFAADVGKDVHRGGMGIGALTGPTIGQLGDAVSVAGGREGPGTFALHAMPANALYSSLAKGGGQADPMFAD